MKKIFHKMLCGIMVLTAIFSVGGCSSNKPSYGDREELQISAYWGEFNYKWLETLAEEWNKTNADSPYYFSVKSDQVLSNTAIEQIKNKKGKDIYFTEDAAYQLQFKNGLFEDLSDLLSVRPDGETGKTIEEKIKNYDQWEQVAKYGDELYLLPYSISPVGFIYNHDYFLKNGWLFDEDGNFTTDATKLCAGKDQKKGTYDDGQPQTEEEFDDMLEAIKVKLNDRVFLFMGKLHPEYVNNMAYAYLAQYLGKDGYRQFIQHDSEGQEVTLYDGTKTVVTIEDGYKMWQSEGVQAMAQRIKKYLCGNYVSNDTKTNANYTVEEIHKYFAGGNEQAQHAFIVEGNWWEFGSKNIIEAAKRYTGVGYGEADYRYMLLPSMKGQRSAENESVLFAQTGGSIMVPKTTPQKKAAIFSFLSYVLRDDIMGRVTAETGLLWNYQYQLKPEQYDSMTLFMKNTYAMVNDVNHVSVYSWAIDAASSPIKAYSNLGATYFIKAGNTLDMFTAINSASSVAEFMETVKNTNNASAWTGYLEQAREYGFYQNL